MVATRAQKRAVTDGSNPLCHTGLLRLVLSFVGGGQGLYVCAVNSKWRACYKALQCVSRLPHSSGHVHTSECTSYAAVFISPQRMRLALRAGMHFSRDEVMLAAGQHASTDLLRLAHDEFAMPWSALLAEGALRGSSRRLGRQKLKWLCSLHSCPLPDSITALAAATGSLKLLEWLCNRGCELNKDTYLSATGRANNTGVLKFLHNSCCPLHDSVSNAAVAAGDLHQLHGLLHRGALLPMSAAWDAVYSGATGICCWMHESDLIDVAYPILMVEAAARRHPQLCKWLHSIECPWSGATTSAAAQYDRSETLRWSYESGCPWNTEEIYLDAVIGAEHSTDTLQYVLEQGLFASAETLTESLGYAGGCNNLLAAKWLRQQGAEWQSVLRDYEGTSWCGELLARARAEGCFAPTE
jgi:hypothetical protein